MPRYRSSIVVANPRREVFDFVSDFRHAAAWDPQVVRATKETDGPIGVGTRFVLVARMLGRETELPYEVTEHVPGRRIVLAGRTKHLTYRDVVDVEEIAEAAHRGTRLLYDATLSLTGPLKPGNLVLRFLLTRIGDDALEGIRRGLGELGSADGGRRDEPPPLDRVDAAAVRAIVALAERPVLRNLRITQGYHLLSERLAGMLGRDDLNWCTYATWASKTAGAFIRGDELRAAVRAVLARRGLRRKLAVLRRALAAVDPRAAEPFSEERVAALVEEVIAEVGAWVRGGNEIVFAELGELFARFVTTFEGDREADAAKLDAFLADLAPGDAEADEVESDGDAMAAGAPLRYRRRGGQGLLAAAMRAYHAALFASDAKRKSELVLTGNALGGLHEQIRLQTYIAGALGTPVEETIYSRGNDALAERVKRQKLGPAQEVLHRLFAPLGEEIAETAREVTTLYLMEQQTPGETLQLGSDLPAPRGGPLYPPRLVKLDDPELVALLEGYGAYGRLAGAKGVKAKARRLLLRVLVALGLYRPTAFGSAAADWTDLGERMRYIFVYFRSRQASADLFQPPFNAEQAAAIAEGRVPSGPL